VALPEVSLVLSNAPAVPPTLSTQARIEVLQAVVEVSVLCACPDASVVAEVGLSEPQPAGVPLNVWKRTGTPTIGVSAGLAGTPFRLPLPRTVAVSTCARPTKFSALAGVSVTR
jgi:hypothetical protein